MPAVDSKEDDKPVKINKWDGSAVKNALDDAVKDPVKINKWDGFAVKNALDNAVKDVLTKKFNYTENFALMDGRLVLCGIAVGVASFALIWDFMYPFPESKPILIFCVSTYFVMMGILTLYTTYKEKGIFAIAVQKMGAKSENVWEASSYLKKYDDKYNLVLSWRDAKNNRRETSVTKSVANFIDTNGSVVLDIVETVVVKMHNSLLSEKKEK